MNTIVKAIAILGLAFVASQAAAHGHDMKDKMKKMDTNNDKKVDATEHATGAKTMFTDMDADKDGFLTTAEMKSGHEKMMKK